MQKYRTKYKHNKLRPTRDIQDTKNGRQASKNLKTSKKSNVLERQTREEDKR
jgi:hypothetical protein